MAVARANDGNVIPASLVPRNLRRASGIGPVTGRGRLAETQLGSRASAQQWTRAPRASRARAHRMRLGASPDADTISGGAGLRALDPSVVVFSPNDVVLTEVGTVLNLDNGHGNLAWVFDSVPRASRHSDHLLGAQPKRAARHDHSRRAIDHDPALSTKAMAL